MMPAYSLKYCSKDVFKDAKPREFQEGYGREMGKYKFPIDTYSEGYFPLFHGACVFIRLRMVRIAEKVKFFCFKFSEI